MTLDQLDEAGVNPYSDVLTLERYRELFGENKHPFTGVDYIQYYSDLIRDCGAEVEVILANDPRAILPYTKKVPGLRHPHPRPYQAPAEGCRCGDRLWFGRSF